MRTYIANVDAKGQIVLPPPIRKRLGIKPNGQVAFEVDGESIRLTPVATTLEAAFGSVTPKNRPEDFKELARQAIEEHVQDVARQMAEQ